jgi:hypothetical protein
VTTGEGRVLRRLPNLHRRAYQSIFGPFDLERVVYGTREGQWIEYVPLDTRLGLPAGKFSYLLQDWDQALAVESPYPQVNGVLQRMWGLEQSVASLEQMTRTLAEAVEVGPSRSRRQQLTKICNYLCRHQARLRYHEYLAAGYPIASGVIEGACRHVVQDRRERAGMHWTIPDAQALLRLRCVPLNGEWEAFMRYRIHQETARLYPHAKRVEQTASPLPLAA